MIFIETSLSVIMGLAVGVGLGAWFPINSVAGRVMVGSLLAPLLLIGLNAAVGVSLSNIAILIYGISLVGMIKFIRSTPRDEMYRVLANPVFVLPLIFLLLLLTIGPIGYQTFEWDEFASWLYWGKELYLADSFNAADLSWRQLGYPQAWSVALAFPQLLYGQFEPMRSLAVGLIWHAAALGAVFELIVTYLKQRKWASSGVNSVVGYSFIFLLLAAEALRKLVPQDFLIELPQIFILSSVFVLFCLAGLGLERMRGLSFTVGTMVAAGMMVKISVIAAVPAAAVMVIHLSLTKKSSVAGAHRILDSALNLGLFLLPVALTLVAWNVYAGQFQSDLSKISISFDYSSDHLALLARLGDAAWAYIGSWKMPLTLVSGIGLAYAAAKREFRPVVIGFMLYVIFYSAGLFQLYAFRFGPFEIAELQSHQRYLRVPLRTMHLLGPVFLFILAVTVVMKSKFDFKHHVSVRKFSGVAILAVFIVGGYQLYVVRQSLADVKERTSLSQERLAVIKNLQRDRQALEETLSGFEKSKPLIALIAQGDDGYSLRVVRYLALANNRGEARTKYRVLNAYSWSESANKKWRAPITASKLTEILQTADIIWGHRRDAWIDGILKNFTAGCRQGLRWRFLVKLGAENNYRCVF